MKGSASESTSTRLGGAAAEAAVASEDVAVTRRRRRGAVDTGRGFTWPELGVRFERGAEGRKELESWGLVRSMAAVGGVVLGAALVFDEMFVGEEIASRSRVLLAVQKPFQTSSVYFIFLF
jgi:hypothetical protein